MKKLFFIVFSFLLLSSSLQAQRPHRCNAPEILESLSPLVKNASLELRRKVNALSLYPKPDLKQMCGTTYRIPVVFHVIHNRGIDSISSSQIQSQMNVLNEDYRKKVGSPGNGSGVDTQIEFYLAKKDQFGNATPGITYTKDSIAFFTYSPTNDTLLKNKIKWPQQSYLNIWVVDTIMYGGSYLLGYAHLPSNGFNSLDGVVIADQHCGRDSGTANVGPYNKGRTLSHEIGHYLNLYHPFDYVTNPCEGDSAANCATQGDFVCDVPPHSGPHYGCPTTPQNTCTEYPKDTNDYIYNYMEYVNDTCMNMFSQGQATRMTNTLDTDSFRIILTSTTNLINTAIEYHGFPDAYFFFLGTGCVCDTMQFMDLSLGLGPNGAPAPDAMWAWSFPGGSPDTSNAQYPRISYPDTGSFVVTLKVTNTFGICQYPMPIYIAGPDLSIGTDTVVQGDSTSFFTFAGEPGTWSWNFGDGSGDSASILPMPKHQYPGPGGFEYTATFTPDDTNQCTVRYIDSTFVLEQILEVRLLDFAGHYDPIQDQNQLTWASSMEKEHGLYLIESSQDGTIFRVIGEIKGKGNSEQVSVYHFSEVNPKPGLNYYRLKMLDQIGKVSYSSLISIFNPKRFQIKTWPNPVRAQQDLQIGFSPGGVISFELSISSLSGQVLIREKSHTDAQGQLRISLENLQSGLYFIEIKDEAGKAIHKGKLVIL